MVVRGFLEEEGEGFLPEINLGGGIGNAGGGEREIAVKRILVDLSIGSREERKGIVTEGEGEDGKGEIGTGVGGNITIVVEVEVIGGVEGV